MIVHEWGTFLGMSGSDGTALEGMYHEEHALPRFVHSRSRDQLWLPHMLIKGETPVIYFYTNVRQTVRVGVAFPDGVWTQWYPQAAVVRPDLMTVAAKPGQVRSGRICWYAEIIPAAAIKPVIEKLPGPVRQPAQPEVKLPAVNSDALWKFARDVDAAYVKTQDATSAVETYELERFLFYRGLGQTRLPLRLKEAEKGTLSLDSLGPAGDGVRDIFVLRIENGRGAYNYHRSLKPGQRISGVIPPMDKSQSMTQFTTTVADLLAARLTEAGLHAKEARAMVNTWRNSYFQNEGVRVLFLLPQSWTDEFIPLTIAPKPKQIVRVMVGRLELLTAKREQLAENAVRELVDQDPAKRQQAFQFLHEQGRYVEPIIRRVANTTTNDTVRTLCRRLLLADMVTELRAAVHNAADGKRLQIDPVLLQAQLARLLREIGLHAEARTEGEAVLATLRKHPTDNDVSNVTSPLALEIRAAAIEAIGDDHTASRIYARRVDLQARSMQGKLDDFTVAWFRDWWVGKAYAHCVAQTGKTRMTIAALERSLARTTRESAGDSDAKATRVLIALLTDGSSTKAPAASSDATPTPSPKLDTASIPAAPAALAADVAGR
jgi:hypothetical protein